MPDATTDLRLVPAALICWLASALAVGLDARTVLVVGGGALTALVAAGLVLRGHLRASVCLTVAAVVAVLASCAVQLHVRESGLLPELVADRATVQVTGTVRSSAVPVTSPWTTDPDQQRYRLALAVEEVTGRGRTSTAAAGVLVLGGPEWADAAYGSRVVATGRLGPSRPGEELRGVLIGHRVRVIEPAHPVDAGMSALRSGLLEASDGLGADARGLVPGAAIGDTSRLPPDLEQAMRDVSLTHITAVSGGHFAVLWVGVLALTSLLRLPRAVRAIGSGAVMAAFVLLVHPEPSVLRAAAMGALAVVGLLAGRPSRAVPALAASVVVLLVLDPWLARSYGFVLSVLATGAIVLLAPPLAEVLERRLPRWLAVVLAVPIAAQAVCAPVVLLLDPVVSVYAVPANALAAPALVPATLLGVAATLTAPWWPAAAGLLVHGAAGATWWIATVARTTADLPGARAPWPAGPGGAVLLALLTAAVLAGVLRADHLPPVLRRSFLAVLVCLTLLVVPGLRDRVLGVVPDGWPPAGWSAVMCDVGQGDALVVRSGPRAAVVVDVGPDGAAADACLDGLGVDRIDLLVLTHHHADHVGGLAPVLAGREVTGAVVSPLALPAGQAARTLEMLHDAGVATRVGVAGDRGTAGEVRWTVLWPHAVTPEGSAGEAAVNDASVVMLLESDALSVLALGDLEPPGQEALADRLSAGGMRPDVLKVAHHGSAHQSARLADLVRAPVALISAGADNTYGHPAPATVSMLRGLGATVLTTVDCGPIAVGTASVPGRELRVTASCVR